MNFWNLLFPNRLVLEDLYLQNEDSHDYLLQARLSRYVLTAHLSVYVLGYPSHHGAGFIRFCRPVVFFKFCPDAHTYVFCLSGWNRSGRIKCVGYFATMLAML